jgi:hypothetical protein
MWYAKEKEKNHSEELYSYCWGNKIRKHEVGRAVPQIGVKEITDLLLNDRG